MAKAKSGDTVKVHYTGKTEEGEVFDSSQGKDPFEFTLGQGNIIPGFENAVVGMEEGDKDTVKVESEQAYGPYRDDLVFKVSQEEVPDELDPNEGEQLQVRQPDGSTVVVTVKDVNEQEVTLDANHPLAGQNLEFDIELVEVSEESGEQEEEKQS